LGLPDLTFRQFGFYISHEQLDVGEILWFLLRKPNCLKVNRNHKQGFGASGFEFNILSFANV
jgi:hypothetical protein